MSSGLSGFPFGIMDVVELLHLRVRRRQPGSVYVDCPFCNDSRGKMNVNFERNVWRYNYCDRHGACLPCMRNDAILPILPLTGKSVMRSRQETFPGKVVEWTWCP